MTIAKRAGTYEIIAFIRLVLRIPHRRRRLLLLRLGQRIVSCRFERVVCPSDELDAERIPAAFGFLDALFEHQRRAVRNSMCRIY